MYFHLIIQLNAVGVAMSLDVSRTALVVETVAIPLVPYYKRPIQHSHSYRPYTIPYGPYDPKHLTDEFKTIPLICEIKIYFL